MPDSDETTVPSSSVSLNWSERQRSTGSDASNIFQMYKNNSERQKSASSDVNSTIHNTKANASEHGSSSSRPPLSARPGLVRQDASRRVKQVSSGAVFSAIRTASNRARVAEEQVVTATFFPWSKIYKTWWGFTVFAAILTIFVETYAIAFTPAGILNPKDASAILEYVLYAVFVLDMAVTFNLAFYNENDVIVYDRRLIAQNYFRCFFWIDLVSVFPFYPIALAITGQLGQDSTLAQYLSLLRLTRMVRLYRVQQLFEVLQYSSRISLLSLTLTRNLGAALVWTHCGACTMYFISRQYGFDEEGTLIGASYANLDEGEAVESSFAFLYVVCILYTL